MATQGPLRRKTDLRPKAALFGPTPAAAEPVERAAFIKSLDHALEASRRGRRFVTLVVVELEPPVSDQAATRTATVVRRMIRETDAMWRTSVGAFTILLADADGPNAEPAVARLRLRLAGEIKEPAWIGRATAAPGVPSEMLVELARTDRRPLVPDSGGDAATH